MADMYCDQIVSTLNSFPCNKNTYFLVVLIKTVSLEIYTLSPVNMLPFKPLQVHCHKHGNYIPQFCFSHGNMTCLTSWLNMLNHISSPVINFKNNLSL